MSIGMNLSRCAFALLLVAPLVPASTRAQTSKGPATRPAAVSHEYENSPDGLRSQLQAIVTASKDPEKFKSLLHELEIPDFEGWFEKSFEPDVQLFWAGSYRRALRGEDNFAAVFTILGHRDGNFKIRKVNGAPTTRLEEVFTNKMKNPVDVFAAGWQRRNAPENSGEQLLGYYFFLDGKFRWFYMLDFPKNQGPAKEGGAVPESGPISLPAGKSSKAPPPSQPR
jgi:hypothetical protein